MQLSVENKNKTDHSQESVVQNFQTDGNEMKKRRNKNQKNGYKS